MILLATQYKPTPAGTKEPKYNDNITEKVFVSFEKRFESFYNCIFGFKTVHNGIPTEEKIGKGTFLGTDKKIFLDIMSFEAAPRNLQDEK